MLDHFFISSTDGSLHDTRDPNWASTPLRECYSRHYPEISTVRQLKATLRAGGHVWPGGYPLYFITSDGGCLSFETVRQEFRNVAWSIANSDKYDRSSDGWRVQVCTVNYEDDLIDDHSGEQIESAYA